MTSELSPVQRGRRELEGTEQCSRKQFEMSSSSVVAITDPTDTFIHSYI